GRIGRRALMEVAHLAAKLDPRIVLVIDDWDRMKASLQNATDLDGLCKAHGVDPAHFIAAVAEAELKYRGRISILVAALNTPAIVAASVKQALTTDGTGDRNMLFQHAGFLPTPRGKQLKTLDHNAPITEVGRGDVRPIPRFEGTVEITEEVMEDDE